MQVVDALCENVNADAVPLMFFARDLKSLPTPRNINDIMLLRGASAGSHKQRPQMIAKVGHRGRPTAGRPRSEFALFDLEATAAVDRAEQAMAQADGRNEISGGGNGNVRTRSQAASGGALVPYQVSSEFSLPGTALEDSLDDLERDLVLRTARWATYVVRDVQRPAGLRSLSGMQDIADELCGLVVASAASSHSLVSRSDAEGAGGSGPGAKTEASGNDAPPPARIMYFWDGTTPQPIQPEDEPAPWLDPSATNFVVDDFNVKTAATEPEPFHDRSLEPPLFERWPLSPLPNSGGQAGKALAGLLPARGVAVAVEFRTTETVQLPSPGSWVMLRYLRRKSRGGLLVLEFGPQSSWQPAPQSAIEEIRHRYRFEVANAATLAASDDAALARTGELVGSNRCLVAAPTSLPLQPPPRTTLRAVLAARDDPRPRRFLVHARVLRAWDGSLEEGEPQKQGLWRTTPQDEAVEPRLELLLEDSTGRLVVGVPPGAPVAGFLGNDAITDSSRRLHALKRLENLSTIGPQTGWGLWCIVAFHHNASHPGSAATHIVVDTSLRQNALE